MKRIKKFTIRGVKMMVSEDYDPENETINTWVHTWNKSKKNWVWMSCSNKPYEDVLADMLKM